MFISHTKLEEAGTIKMTGEACSPPPTGWKLCDGTAVSRTAFARLFSKIGTTYGAGDGATTFNLPNLVQRFPLGKAASGVGVNLGDTGGNITHTHDMSNHTHTIGLGSHTHTINYHGHALPKHYHSRGSLAASSSCAEAGAGVYATTPSGGTSAGVAVSGGGGSVNWWATNHSHSITTTLSGTIGNTDGPWGDAAYTTTGQTDGMVTNGPTGSASCGAPSVTNTAGENPPFQVVNFIIKT